MKESMKGTTQRKSAIECRDPCSMRCFGRSRLCSRGVGGADLDPELILKLLICGHLLVMHHFFLDVGSWIF